MTFSLRTIVNNLGFVKHVDNHVDNYLKRVQSKQKSHIKTNLENILNNIRIQNFYILYGQFSLIIK